ncbi:MAG TPA: peptidase MA family metallohydrolase [Chloroflexia bacterium]|nr:peptidase MA family metallohydrolase [Chloroflexia bacterium]
MKLSEHSNTRHTSVILSLVLLLTSLFIFVAPPSATAAPLGQVGTIQLQQNTAKVRYREGISFQVGALVNGGGEVNKAQLKVRYGKRGNEESYDVKLANGAGSYTLYEDSHGLATGMPIIYSWVLSDGKVQYQTPPQTVIYEDKSKTWYQHEGPEVTVRWYDGDGSYGELMYRLATDTLATYKRRFNIDPTDQIYITIYGSDAAYHAAFPEVPSWSGGFSRYGGEEIVAIAPQGYNAGVFIGEGIPHELSHAALYQFLRGPAPRWLDEGFAVYNQNVISIKQYDDLLQKAYRGGTLIDFSKLNTRWPSDGDQALLAYAEGRSFVTFLINSYGNDVWSNVLDQLRRNDADGAMKQVFGQNLAYMADLWKTKVLAGEDVTMPPALKSGPVPSLPSENDLKARVTGEQPAQPGSGVNSLTLPLVGIAGFVVVLLVVLSFLIVRRRKSQDLESTPLEISQRDQDYILMRNNYYTGRPEAAPVNPMPIPPVTSSFNFNAQTATSYSGYNPLPSVPNVPAPVAPHRIQLQPPSLQPGLSFTGAVPAAHQPASGEEDPFNLIVSRFNQPPASPVKSTTIIPNTDLHLDPYGLNMKLNENEQK